MPAPLQFYDNYTRSLRPFAPLAPGPVGLYTCGPTVYDYQHIGNYRTFLFEDVLKRVLEWNGYAVRHVMNITDVGHLTYRLRPGHTPSRFDCDYTGGMLSQAPVVFGLPAARVRHVACQSRGAEQCVYELTWQAPDGHGLMRRIPDVADAWFDSGAMPVAQWHYPFENQELFKIAGQADYISEAIDQTRGWFYTLHAVSTLLFDRPAFKNVICLGHILDAKGEKMSKSRGNIVNPFELVDQFGADAVRWYMYASAPPYNPRRFGPEQVGEMLRQFMLTLWNTYSFFVTYANLDGWQPSAAGVGSWGLGVGTSADAPNPQSLHLEALTHPTATSRAGSATHARAGRAPTA